MLNPLALRYLKFPDLGVAADELHASLIPAALSPASLHQRLFSVVAGDGGEGRGLGPYLRMLKLPNEIAERWNAITVAVSTSPSRGEGDYAATIEDLSEARIAAVASDVADLYQAVRLAKDDDERQASEEFDRVQGY